MANVTASSEVGARYAGALLDLAVETGVLNAVESDLATLKAMLAESADLRTLVASPKFDAEQKGKAFTAVATRAGACETTVKFLGLLAANRRASSLPTVIDAFQRLAAARRGVTLAKVTTAVELTKAQAKDLASALRAALGGDPQIETAVDPAILGGLKVRVGSRLFDASLKTKLDSLKFALKRA
ncbi:MAG TPA: F0F1 ATP synthase subunit delta [Caulobacteraceae bacterium]